MMDRESNRGGYVTGPPFACTAGLGFRLVGLLAFLGLG